MATPIGMDIIILRNILFGIAIADHINIMYLTMLVEKVSNQNVWLDEKHVFV